MPSNAHPSPSLAAASASVATECCTSGSSARSSPTFGLSSVSPCSEGGRQAAAGWLRLDVLSPRPVTWPRAWLRSPSRSATSAASSTRRPTAAQSAPEGSHEALEAPGTDTLGVDTDERLRAFDRLGAATDLDGPRVPAVPFCDAVDDDRRLSVSSTSRNFFVFCASRPVTSRAPTSSSKVQPEGTT